MGKPEIAEEERVRTLQSRNSILQQTVTTTMHTCQHGKEGTYGKSNTAVYKRRGEIEGPQEKQATFAFPDHPT
jgi:hypothetical protein